MVQGWSRPVLSLVSGACLLVGGCSSSSPDAPRASVSLPPGTSVTTTYVTAVNGLCDALLPKVVEVTHGGSLDVPVADYLAQQPAHAKLLADFDRQLAQLPVPPEATKESKALTDYVAFANRLDAARLAAAKQGAAAYANEIHSEVNAANDPTITALKAAGFHDSCQAR